MIYMDSKGQFFSDADSERCRFVNGRMELYDASEEETEECAAAIHDQIWDEVCDEARGEIKKMARAAFAHGDASCDAIADQFGLSRATVRGMSNGRRNARNMTLTDNSQSGDLRAFVAEDCGW